MSISPIGSRATWPLQSSPQTGNWQNVLGAAASALGMGTGDLQSQLASGSSISSIASAKGVAQGTLIESITTALKQNGQLSGASDSQLQQVATRIANRTPAAQGHHHHHGPGADGSSSSGGGSPGQGFNILA